MAPPGMPVTLHPSAVPPDPANVLNQYAMWLWFMLWNSYVKKVDKGRVEGVYHHDRVITLDEMPKWVPLVAAET